MMNMLTKTLNTHFLDTEFLVPPCFPTGCSSKILTFWKHKSLEDDEHAHKNLEHSFSSYIYIYMFFKVLYALFAFGSHRNT